MHYKLKKLNVILSGYSVILLLKDTNKKYKYTLYEYL